jgi:hypothetical protein
LAFQLDLPKFESLDTQVLGVSVDHIGAQKAFAETLGLTYPLLDDFSRDIVQKYGVMDDDPKSPLFRYAKRPTSSSTRRAWCAISASWTTLATCWTQRRFWARWQKSSMLSNHAGLQDLLRVFWGGGSMHPMEASATT